ncbi:MAG: hypothetical protein CMI31_03775 [Opitutae bacterium]|nr:hypothetical protein [Opitutae bacterium]
MGFKSSGSHDLKRLFASSGLWFLVIGTTFAQVERPDRLPEVEFPTQAAVKQAVDKGCSFLQAKQNPNGSWGSPRNTKGMNIFAPVPGSHRAFQLAVTSLCTAALIEIKSNDPTYAETILRGENHLLEKLPYLRRATPVAIYNVWAHAYGIQALVRMKSRLKANTDANATRLQRIDKVINHQIGMLQRYESIDGGWGYYDFNAQTKQPSGSSISFVNATALIALHEAKQAGIDSPAKMVKKAYDAIQRQRLPDHSYLYGEYLKWKPRRGINRPGGSLGRSHPCNLALDLWGDASVTSDVHKLCLDRLIARNGWLDVARKRPIPHESWFAVAGYFYYYGHYYAAFCIKALPQKEQSLYQKHLAAILVPLQEKDGSWWDFPFYDYHQQYGTAMALMALQRCRLK